jgi:thiaminase
VPEDQIPSVVAYEREAASYGLAMLHQIGITDIDQWFCNYTACDQAYLLHFYRTGQKGDFRDFWISNAPLIKPQPIPAFVPTRRAFRMDGIVI